MLFSFSTRRLRRYAVKAARADTSRFGKAIISALAEGHAIRAGYVNADLLLSALAEGSFEKISPFTASSLVSVLASGTLGINEIIYGNGELGDYWEASDLTKLFQLNNGTVPVTGAGETVGYFGGQRGQYNLTQSSAASRPTYEGSGNSGALSFDNDSLSIASSTGTFNYMHNGAGGTSWVIARVSNTSDKYIWGNKGNNSTGIVGSVLSRSNTLVRGRLVVANGTQLVFQLGAGSGWALDTWVMLLASYSTADGGRVYFNGVEVATGAELFAPSAANAAGNWAINGTSITKVRACGLVNRVISAAEAAFLYNRYLGQGLLNP